MGRVDKGEAVFFPNNLRTIRENEGVGLSELARESGLSERTLRDTESGIRCPRPHNRNKIVRALNNLIRRRTKPGDPAPKQYTHEEIFQS